MTAFGPEASRCERRHLGRLLTGSSVAAPIVARNAGSGRSLPVCFRECSFRSRRSATPFRIVQAVDRPAGDDRYKREPVATDGLASARTDANPVGGSDAEARFPIFNNRLETDLGVSSYPRPMTCTCDNHISVGTFIPVSFNKPLMNQRFPSTIFFDRVPCGSFGLVQHIHLG